MNLLQQNYPEISWPKEYSSQSFPAESKEETMSFPFFMNKTRNIPAIDMNSQRGEPTAMSFNALASSDRLPLKNATLICSTESPRRSDPPSPHDPISDSCEGESLNRLFPCAEAEATARNSDAKVESAIAEQDAEDLVSTKKTPATELQTAPPGAQPEMVVEDDKPELTHNETLPEAQDDTSLVEVGELVTTPKATTNEVVSDINVTLVQAGDQTDKAEEPAAPVEPTPAAETPETTVHSVSSNDTTEAIPVGKEPAAETPAETSPQSPSAPQVQPVVEGETPKTKQPEPVTDAQTGHIRDGREDLATTQETPATEGTVPDVNIAFAQAGSQTDKAKAPSLQSDPPAAEKTTEEPAAPVEPAPTAETLANAPHSVASDDTTEAIPAGKEPTAETPAEVSPEEPPAAQAQSIVEGESPTIENEPASKTQTEPPSPQTEPVVEGELTETKQNASAAKALAANEGVEIEEPATKPEAPASAGQPVPSAIQPASPSAQAEPLATPETTMESPVALSPAPPPPGEPVVQQSAPETHAAPMPSDRIVTLEKLSEDIDRMILRTLRTDSHSMRIELQPAELGRMVLHCRETRAGLTVEISVQSQEVRTLLESNEQSLRNTLQNQGMQMSRFSVSCNDGENGASNSHSNRSFSRSHDPRTGQIDSVEEVPVIKRDKTWSARGSRNHWIA